MNKKGYYVNVYANKNKKDSNYLKIRCEGFECIIPKSYVEENNLFVKDGNMFINKDLFENWFKDAIMAKEEEFKKRVAIFNSFYPHIPLFWKNRYMIRQNARYYSVQTPQHFMGLAYLGASTITNNFKFCFVFLVERIISAGATYYLNFCVLLRYIPVTLLIAQRNIIGIDVL